MKRLLSKRQFKKPTNIPKTHLVILLHFAAAVIAVTAFTSNSASGSSLSTPQLLIKAKTPNGTTVSAATNSASDLDKIVSAPEAVEPAPPPTRVSIACPMDLNATETEICLATNKERTDQGLQMVYWDKALSEVAVKFAQDMSKRGYFSHTSPDGQTMKNRIEQAGISYGYAGENIAMGYSNGYDAVTGWMNSKGHRENILKPEYSRIGAAQVGEHFVQIFTGEMK